MSIYIGHASISETNKVNGQLGDQTKKEVCIRTWYDKNWDFMAIHPDPKVREAHAKAVEDICSNDYIGYGQSDRNTLYARVKEVNFNVNLIRTHCNCDCSSMQNVAAVISGSKATYSSNGWVTFNMLDKLKEAGYIIINNTEFLKNPEYCVRGAIYVKISSHTVCGLTSGSLSSKTLTFAGLLPETETIIEDRPTKSIKATKPAKSFDKSIAGKYKVTASELYMRNGAGKDNSAITSFPKNFVLQCFGYYSTDNGEKWLYVQGVQNNTQYTGFCHSKYLKKL